MNDAFVPLDTGTSLQKDTMVATTPDVESPPVTPDAANVPDAVVISPPPPESPAKSDAGVPVITPDAAVVIATADAGVTHKDAGTSPPVDQPVKQQSSGCSISTAPGAGGALPALVLAALVLGFRRRRR